MPGSRTNAATRSSAVPSRPPSRRCPSRRCGRATTLFYWTQLVVVFAFLVILPTGEHFHIVTALPALFFRRGRPANVVPKIDLDAAMAGDGDAEMRIGVTSARDLTWKDGLDAFTCTECGRCKDACPTFLTGKPLSLKWVNDSLKRHLSDQREVLVAGAADSALPPLVPDVIREETLWACTTCGYCEAACPIELEHLPKFYRMRQHRVMMDGEFPARAARGLRRLRSAEQPVGSARRHARRLGDRGGRPDPRERRGGGRPRLPLLRRLRGVLRCARSEDRHRLRRHPQGGGGPVRGPRSARDLHRRVRAPRRQRDAVPAARHHAGRDAERIRHPAHRDLRSARVQLAQERVPRIRRPLRSRSTTPS